MKLANGKVTLHAGDCLEVLATLAENSIDAVVTDPPYELGFMGRSWDKSGIAFTPDTWALVWRVLKPGGHLVAFGAPKNYHRLACAIEDAGFEIRDSLMWVFGSGFPKSLDVSKAIDKATDAAREWAGWGTALKPAYEPIVLARKPLSEGTVAANVLRWGTGGINIDATRVSMSDNDKEELDKKSSKSPTGKTAENVPFVQGIASKPHSKGRWPANLCHDGSQEVMDLFPETGNGNGKGAYSYAGKEYNNKDTSMFNGDKPQAPSNYNDNGSAARFFYCAKANKHDRAGSKHPTVKPINLMRWLVRMVTPPGGTVLDPFAGSGTTGLAAVLEGFDAQLIEREAEYQADIQRRFDD